MATEEEQAGFGNSSILENIRIKTNMYSLQGMHTENSALVTLATQTTVHKDSSYVPDDCL